MRLIGIENEMFLRLLTRAPRTSIASWVMIGARKDHREESGGSRKPHILTRKTGQCEAGANRSRDSGRLCGLWDISLSPATRRQRRYEVSTTCVSGWAQNSISEVESIVSKLGCRIHPL